MASEGGGKIKNKRGHSTTKPYERRKSLFRRITDSIKDVLRPSWLSSEVSGDDGSAVLVGAEPLAASDRQLGNANTASHGQTSLQSEPGQQFAGSSQGDGMQLQGSSSTSEGLSQHTQPQLYKQHPNALANARFSWQQQQQSHLATGNMSHSDNSQLMRTYSTTGPRQRQGVGAWQSGMERPRGSAATAASTSILPVSQPRQRRLRMSESETSQAQGSMSHAAPELDADRDQSVLAGSASLLGDVPTADLSHSAENPAGKRQRLWSPETPRRGRSLQPAVQDKPAFKISVFCSPNQSMNESLHESSFYSGKTTYGGFSASRRRNMNSSLPYQNSLPLRNPVKAKPLNTSSNAVLSSSAAQILRTLERLSDAKKTQASDTSVDSVLSFTPSSYRKPSRPLQTATPSRMLQLPSRGPPIGQLQSPSVASIAKNHQIVTLTAPRSQKQPSSTQNRGSEDSDDDVQVVEDTTERAGSRSNLPSYQDAPSGSGSGKMKRAKTYETRPKARKDEDEVTEVPNLRTDFTLPIQSMPAFNLGSTSFPSTLKPPATAASAKEKGGAPPLQFTFSSPIHKSGPSPSGSTPVATEGFQFSSPLQVAQTMPPSLGRSTGSVFGGTSCESGSGGSGLGAPVWGSTAPKAKSLTFGSNGGKSANQLSEGLGASGTSSISVASASSSDSPPKPAAQLMTGSVMDILGGGKSDAAAAASPTMSGVKPASSLRQGSVMDILGKEGASSKSNTGTDDLFAKFKKPAGSWDCGTCMVQNKPEATKCACCETPKPGASSGGSSASSNMPSSTSAPSGGTDSLFAKFLKPAGAWDCEVCLVQNKAEATKCAACETPKPGCKSAASSNTSSSTSAPSGGTDSLFAKFLKPAGAWDCDMCLVQNKAEATKCVACESPKPGSKPAAGNASPAKTDDLFAKFRKPAGSWECDVCMVQNTEAQTRCLACESPRPGTQSTGCVPSSGAGFIGSGPTLTIAPGGGLALSGLSSSSKASPFLTGGTTQKDSATTGFTFGVKDSTTTGVTFGGATVNTTSSSGGGFKFGGSTVSPSKTETTTDGGFKLSTGGSTASKDSSGFKFGDKDLSNSNSASPSSVVFGKTDSPKSDAPPVASLSGGFKFGSSASSQSVAGTGFQFGATSNVSSTSISAGLGQTTVTSSGSTRASASSVAVSSSAFGSSFGSVSSAAGFSFGDSSTAPTKGDRTKNNGVSASAVDSVSGAGSSSEKKTFTPVFGLGQPASSNSLGVAPSVMSSGFQFGASSTSDSSSSSVFGSNLSSKVNMPESEPAKSEGGVSVVCGAKQSSISSSFSFQAGAKPNIEGAPQAGLFTSALGGKNGESGPTSGFAFGAGATPSNTTPAASGFVLCAGATSSMATTSAATPSGFAFGSSTPVSTNTTTSLFGATPQQNSWSGADSDAKSSLAKPDLGGAKPTVNGEVGGPSGLFVFGQQPANTSMTGFAFGAQTNSAADNAVSPPKQMFAFGGSSSSSAAGGKRTLDQNDSGPSDAKKRGFFSGGASATGSAEPFKFGNPASTAATNSIFKFGQPSDGAADKAQSLPAFGGTAPVFGATAQTGLFSSGQNSVGSTQSVFGSGGGGSSSTTTGQFSFGAGTNSQSNAAAASAFPADAANTGFGSGAGTGFNFTPNSGPSFNFGANSSTTSAPANIFQFGTTPAADAAPVQPAAGSVFAFGQSAQPADSTTPTPAFSAPTGMGFGAQAAPAQSNFTIGSGDGTRKIKRAVRRGARK